MPAAASTSPDSPGSRDHATTATCRVAGRPTDSSRCTGVRRRCAATPGRDSSSRRSQPRTAKRPAGEHRGVTHSDQRGIVRGCCLGLLMLLILSGGSVFVADRALAAPVLGAPPAGPSHGATEAAIAVALGKEMAEQLINTPHGVVVLSEQDLTVLADANNPHPTEYRNIQVRVRGGLVVVSAQISAGPFTPTGVVHISLS